ncbi:hypothetical protein TrST_g1092 [Triparma strigata]|uniref:Uncharacterized protein n=1 Tax=Triparma strigata TaxID=1606541 RepID=A0A9W7BYM2_9STRA|nr:hypothetical protein TrST_g1092 [Triparma strigata]
MPRPTFDASFSASSSMKSSSFGEPPTLNTRTGKLARKTHLKNLLSIANSGPSEPKVVQPTFRCSICARLFPNPDALSFHARACAMLKKGEVISEKWKVTKPARSSSKVRTQRGDGLEALLKKTAEMGGGFSANIFGGDGDGNLGSGLGSGFSSNFNTNGYVKQKLERQRKEREEAREKLRQAKMKIETEWDFRADDREREKEEARRELRRTTFDSKEHEARWSQFVNRSRGKNPLKIADVPFIPEAQRESLKGKLDKAQVRAMILRWHPDKFGSTYGSKFRPEDVELVMEGVKETSRLLLEILKMIG